MADIIASGVVVYLYVMLDMDMGVAAIEVNVFRAVVVAGVIVLNHAIIIVTKNVLAVLAVITNVLVVQTLVPEHVIVHAHHALEHVNLAQAHALDLQHQHYFHTKKAISEDDFESSDN